MWKEKVKAAFESSKWRCQCAVGVQGEGVTWSQSRKETYGFESHVGPTLQLTHDTMSR